MQCACTVNASKYEISKQSCTSPPASVQEGWIHVHLNISNNPKLTPPLPPPQGFWYLGCWVHCSAHFLPDAQTDASLLPRRRGPGLLIHCNVTTEKYLTAIIKSLYLKNVLLIFFIKNLHIFQEFVPVSCAIGHFWNQ